MDAPFNPNENPNIFFKFLTPWGTTENDQYGSFVYNLPGQNEKYGRPTVHPDPISEFDNSSDSGHGRLHVMNTLDAQYAPSQWWPWFAISSSIVSQSAEKSGVVELRLRRISPQLFHWMIRRGWTSGVDLGRANLSRADLGGADLGRADLSEADLGGANLSGANLSGANLSGANLSGANLSEADLSGANLSGANLSGPNLSEADLSGARLGGADLSGANLDGANLSGARLGGANLIWANLGGANLSGARLGGANLIWANLKNTIGINQ